MTLGFRFKILSLVICCLSIAAGCAQSQRRQQSQTKVEEITSQEQSDEDALESSDASDSNEFAEVATPAAAAPTSEQSTIAEAVNPDEAWLKSATLEEKIGQMFIFGFMGETLEEGLGQTLEQLRPGAIIVFGRNIKTPKQVVELLYGAQQASMTTSRLPLLVAVDQEGGNVIRLKTSPPLPSALALGESGDPRLVYRAGLYTGQLLKTFGFNMNLAPVLDVADPDRDPFLGTRTFGKDAKHASLMGANFSAGLSDAEVMPTAKHFPGHGGVNDSHKSTPVKRISIDNLKNYDLVPFAEGLKEVPLSAVMLAHISYPQIDPSGVPATFSKPIVTDLLRNSLGFNGLIMTDDIEMAGAFAVKDPSERALRSIEAGVDLVMIAWNKRIQAGAIRAVTKAVKSGRVSEERIDTSVRRILSAKRKYAERARIARPTTQQVRSVLKNKDLQSLATETLRKRFEQVAQSPTPSPPRKPASVDGSIFVFATQARFFDTLKNSLKNRTVRFYQLGKRERFNTNRVLRSNLDATAVIHVTGAQSARFANRLPKDLASRVIIINSETRGLIANPEKFKNVVDVHFRHPDLGKMTAEYFFSGPRKAPAPTRTIRETASVIETTSGATAPTEN
jgi:beta-N-acetylhexosaminidase